MVSNIDSQDFLTCLICLELAHDVVECEACNNIMCEICVSTLKKRECPNCRQINFVAKPNILARRMIMAIPCDCPHGCPDKTTRGNLKDHVKKCANKPLKCNAEGC